MSGESYPLINKATHSFLNTHLPKSFVQQEKDLKATLPPYDWEDCRYFPLCLEVLLEGSRGPFERHKKLVTSISPPA